jgi:hypothetical protein
LAFLKATKESEKIDADKAKKSKKGMLHPDCMEVFRAARAATLILSLAFLAHKSTVTDNVVK